MAFHCTICGEESTRICVWCTKDTCANHLCERCGRCSDCCECEVPLEEAVYAVPVHGAHMPEHPEPTLEIAREPEPANAAPVPEPPHPPPDPDPFPEPDAPGPGTGLGPGQGL